MTLDKFVDLLTEYCNSDIEYHQVASFDHDGIFYNTQEFTEFLEALDKIRYNLNILDNAKCPIK